MKVNHHLFRNTASDLQECVEIFEFWNEEDYDNLSAEEVLYIHKIHALISYMQTEYTDIMENIIGTDKLNTNDN